MLKIKFKITTIKTLAFKKTVENETQILIQKD